MSRFYCLILLGAFSVGLTSSFSEAQPARAGETLDRGLVARIVEGRRVYLGWRLLDNDPADVAFHVERSVEGGTAETVTRDPIRESTNVVDTPPPAAKHCTYRLLVVRGDTREPAGEVSMDLAAPSLPYLSIPLQGDYTFQKCAIADLDGDGRLDYVIKQPNSNVDPWHLYWKRSPGTFQIEAYRHDGKPLWRRDLGWSIEQGIWYSPYLAYDLDGDGRAEVALKTGAGDPRDEDGKVTSGPEFLSIWSGLTGEEIAKLPWPSREGFPETHTYNYYCRNQLCVAYLDGKTPCLVVVRGTYNTIKVIAYQLRAGKLEELWTWRDSEGGPRFRGQGAHTTKAADIDGDGRDEVLLGSAVLDDNGTALWSTGRGHPDHFYVADIDPTRPGLEIYYGIEPAQKEGALCLVDAATGTELWKLDEATRHVHSSGLCADIDPRYVGLECYAGERDFEDKRWLFSAKGELLSTEDMGLAPRAAFWDEDPYREIVREGRIHDYLGGEHPPRIQGSVIGVADVIGDWREEIITSVPGELRIYTTTIPASDRRVCLLRDPIYRLDVATQSMGYTQIPMLSTCMATGPATAARPPIEGDWKLVWGDEFDGTEVDDSKWEKVGDGKRRDAFWLKKCASLDGKGHLVVRSEVVDGKLGCGGVRSKDRFEHSYGYYEIRCKVPDEVGTWAAFWLYAPAVGKVGNGGRDGAEIDIFEAVWRDEDLVNVAVHWDGYGEQHKSWGKRVPTPGVNEGFHTFGLHWKKDAYVFYYDGKEISRSDAGGVCEVPLYVKVTTEIGKWAGDIAKAKLPDDFVVDYVRVFEEVDSR